MGESLSPEEILRFVRAARAAFGISKVRLTGGEPLMRPDLVDLVRRLAGEGIGDLALTTNGHRLAALAHRLRDAGLQRVNVSLDSLDTGVYRCLTRGGDPAPALRGIDAALLSGLRPVKINTVVLRGHNDTEVTRLAQWALDRGCQIRFLELMPIGCAACRFHNLFVPMSETRERLRRSFRLALLPQVVGQTSCNFRAHDRAGRRGTIGFVASQTRPFCTGCKRLRLTSRGYLIGCLVRGDGVDVRHLLRDGSVQSARVLGEALTRVLRSKRPHPAVLTAHSMAAVGG